MKNRPVPPWFGQALAIAMHQDKKRSWPFWKRWGHYLLVSWHCPCCIAERSQAMKDRNERHRKRMEKLAWEACADTEREDEP